MVLVVCLSPRKMLTRHFNVPISGAHVCSKCNRRLLYCSKRGRCGQDGVFSSYGCCSWKNGSQPLLLVLPNIVCL